MPIPLRERLTPAVRMGLAISVATGMYGISFGALAVTAGLTVWQACALSALMFTGGSQFAFIGVIAGGGTGAAAWGAATMLGIRNGIYGMQIKALLRPSSRRIPLMAQITIDESNATATSQDILAEQHRGFWTAGVGVYVLWNLFTLVGALAGDAMGDPKQWGLDGAACAAFLGLLWPRLKSRDPIAIAVVSAAITVITIPIVPPGIPVIIAALVTEVVWEWRHHGDGATADEGATP
ncbi:MAG: AzlC family ABC transporter permease [Propionibacterium freudenreichii]